MCRPTPCPASACRPRRPAPRPRPPPDRPPRKPSRPPRSRSLDAELSLLDGGPLSLALGQAAARGVHLRLLLDPREGDTRFEGAALAALSPSVEVRWSLVGRRAPAAGSWPTGPSWPWPGTPGPGCATSAMTRRLRQALQPGQLRPALGQGQPRACLKACSLGDQLHALPDPRVADPRIHTAPRRRPAKTERNAMQTLRIRNQRDLERLKALAAGGAPCRSRPTSAKWRASWPACAKRGDAALLDYARRFDGFKGGAKDLRLAPGAVRAAYAKVDKAFIRAVDPGHRQHPGLPGAAQAQVLARPPAAGRLAGPAGAPLATRGPLRARRGSAPGEHRPHAGRAGQGGGGGRRGALHAQPWRRRGRSAHRGGGRHGRGAGDPARGRGPGRGGHGLRHRQPAQSGQGGGPW